MQKALLARGPRRPLLAPAKGRSGKRSPDLTYEISLPLKKGSTVRTSPLLAAGLLTIVFASCGPEKSGTTTYADGGLPPEPEKPYCDFNCQAFGGCVFTEGCICDPHLIGDTPCTLNGTPVSSFACCKPHSDAHCLESTGCPNWGDCSLQWSALTGNECAPSTMQHCLNSDACNDIGYCLLCQPDYRNTHVPRCTTVDNCSPL